MSKSLTHTVPPAVDRQRIGDYLPGVFDVLPTRASVKKALKRSFVKVEGKAVDSAHWVKAGEVIELSPDVLSRKPVYKRKMEVAYEDEYMAVVNKPPGILTRGNAHQTVENALPFNLDISRTFYVKPVHRLDRATGGLIVVAKNAQAASELGRLFEMRKVEKTYHAIVTEPTPGQALIEEPIDDKPAITEMKQVGTSINERYYLLELKPRTGRTHQLRIHCADQGFPILGDQLYGEKTVKKGLFLWATGLKFVHPVTGEKLEIEIEIPRKFQKILER